MQQSATQRTGSRAARWLARMATRTDAIRVAHPGATGTPYLMVQASDARHFARFSDSVHGFMPFDPSSAQLVSLDAADEHLTVAVPARGVAFYRELLRRS